jgi:predicted O-methyltransferase YrrM
LAGYSTLWLAKGAPNAQILTIEKVPEHVEIAQENFAHSPFGKKIQIFEGEALDILQQFVQQKQIFDMIFLDADKENYPNYLPLLLKLSQKGTLLLTDNLIPKIGEINRPHPDDLVATRTYQYNELLRSEERAETILIPTIVGDQGRLDALGITLLH